MTQFILQNKPQLTQQNLGGKSQIVATPGLGTTYGAPATVASASANTLSPEAAQQAATTQRGQNITDATEAHAQILQRQIAQAQLNKPVLDQSTNAFLQAPQTTIGQAPRANPAPVVTPVPENANQPQ